MNETIIEIIKTIIAILPFSFMAFLATANNLPKSERSKQFFMPVVAVVYVIIAMFAMDSVTAWLIDFINNIPVLITQFADQQTWLPAQISQKIYEFSAWLQEYIKNIDLIYWVFFVANILIYALYLFIKKVALKIFAKLIKTDSSIHRAVAEKFYEFFWEKNKWCLKENYVQARNLLDILYVTVIVISSGMMLISRELYYSGVFKTVFFPVFGIILVGELVYYLGGTTRREYSNDILGENENAYKTVNYSLLRKYLRSMFADKLLSENTSINSSIGYEYTTEDILRDIEKDEEDQKVLNFVNYFKALHKTGFTVDHNYLNSSLDMLNGKSILFNNPFYNDLIPYAFYPMNRALLNHQKVLIVLGRHSIEDDIVKWVEKGISAITNIPFLWNIEILSSETKDCDIGIITRSDVLDIEMHDANSTFFEQVGFMVVIEPSKLITTAQIGLNLIVKNCRKEEKEILYCLCDKNCDGLVDAMSHILMTNITEVSATNKHKGTSSYMCWESDEEYLHHRLLPNISHYLGVGTELSFAALKNQVSKTKWYGGEAFPVTDMRWINKQYYYDLAKYACIPATQDALDDHFETSSNFWSAKVEKNGYLTVEDEFFNMYEILRTFSTRTTEQGFVNVISSEYLLKDYMVANASIFESDAKAIPHIVADYVRSNRNTILRLILMMATFPISEETLEKEFSIIGIDVFNLKKQLWFEIFSCYAPTNEVAALPYDYRQAVIEAFEKSFEMNGLQITSDLITIEEKFNLNKGKLEMVYSIVDSDFIKFCVRELKSAGYIAEDEKGEKYYLGAELCGHIYQKCLPGQFFTFGGKYYEMQYLTSESQVLIRRAADHINGRQYYRQARIYNIHGLRSSEKIGARLDINGMKVVKEFADLSVETPGYYRMGRYNDFANAKYVSFEGDKNGIPQRVYRNKEILKIEFPEIDGKFNDNIRYTIALMFNEIFKTIFAENHAYICAVTDLSFLESDEKKPLTYSIKGECDNFSSKAIYILEDSQLDLGLIVAVERNLQRIFSIVYDYIDWHLETLEHSLNPDDEDDFSGDEKQLTDDSDKKKSSLLEKLIKLRDKVKKLFKGSSKKGKETPEKPEDVEPKEPEDQTDDAEKPENEDVPENIEVPELPENTEPSENDEEPVAEEEKSDDNEDLNEPVEKSASEEVENKEALTDIIEDDDIDDVEGNNAEESFSLDDNPTPNSPAFEEPVEEDEAQENQETTSIDFSEKKKFYHEKYYMLFGGENEFPWVDLIGTLSYLSEVGLEINPLKQAREGLDIAEMVEATFKPGKPDARYCDFCGNEIYGVEYETLSDGRDRCIHCSKTALKTEEEFRLLFEDVKRNMETFFGIRINVGIKVEMVNSKTLHKRLGQSFVPTAKSDGRVLGVAIKKKDEYRLMIENGAPRISSMLTVAHELTHIWQYINWNDKDIRKKYGKKMQLEVYEGMAKWVEIQYAYLINEPGVAKREEIITSYRDDEYGRGFLRYRENYPFSRGTLITKATPFMDKTTPLSLDFCGAITVRMPGTGVNRGDVENVEKTKKKRGEKEYKPIEGEKARNPESLQSYAYNLLSADEKKLYELAMDAIVNFSTELIVSEISIESDAAHKVVNYIQTDHPEIFWFNYGTTVYFDTATKIVNKLTFKYCMTPEEKERRQEKIDEATRAFLTHINDGMCDYEVVLRLYENIIKLVDYDTIGLEKQEKIQLTPEIPDDLRSIYGVFVNKKAVCAGYAKAMQYLMQLCGLECTYITSKTHAWNLIKLEGDYYHLDVTWGDGSNTKKEKSTSEYVSYDCFCMTTEEVLKLKEHVPVEDMPIPECTATKCNYYVRQGLLFEKFELSAIRDVFCAKLKEKRVDVSFKFKTTEELQKAKTILIDDGKVIEIIKYANLKSGTRVDTSYRYSHSEEKMTLAFFLKKL